MEMSPIVVFFCPACLGETSKHQRKGFICDIFYLHMKPWWISLSLCLSVSLISLTQCATDRVRLWGKCKNKKTKNFAKTWWKCHLSAALSLWNGRGIFVVGVCTAGACFLISLGCWDDSGFSWQVHPRPRGLPSQPLSLHTPHTSHCCTCCRYPLKRSLASLHYRNKISAVSCSYSLFL